MIIKLLFISGISSDDRGKAESDGSTEDNHERADNDETRKRKNDDDDNNNNDRKLRRTEFSDGVAGNDGEQR